MRDEVDGVGLGLSISKYIVEAHGAISRGAQQPGKREHLQLALPVLRKHRLWWRKDVFGIHSAYGLRTCPRFQPMGVRFESDGNNRGGQPPVWDPPNSRPGTRVFAHSKKGDYGKAASYFRDAGRKRSDARNRPQCPFWPGGGATRSGPTPEEYAEAVSAWEYWSGQARSGLQGEDPRMLTPFVARLAALQAEKNDPAFEQPRKVPRDASNSGSGYRGTLQSKEREVESLRAKLEGREREVRRLRHQLESLEEIHRKYQEKKQEASSP